MSVIRSGQSATLRRRDFPPIGVDPRRPKVLQVQQYWGETLLDARHFGRGQDVRVGANLGHRWFFLGVDMGWVPSPLRYVLPYTPPMWSEVSSDWKSDFYADDERLPVGEDHLLFRTHGSNFVAHIDPGWTAILTEAEEATPVSGEVTLCGQAVLEVQIGGLRFVATRVPEANRLLSRRDQEPDYPFLAIGSFLGFLGTVFAAAMFFAPAPAQIEVNQRQLQLVEMMVRPMEPARKRPTPQPTAAGRSADEGTVGRKHGTHRDIRATSKVLKKVQEDRRVAMSAGLLAPMGADSELDSLFSSATLDPAVMRSVGGLIGVKGTKIGSNGLNSRGSGLGQQGGVGTIGDGLGTHGIGGGIHGYGADTLGVKRVGTVTHSQEPILIGPMDKSMIDAVIKRHMSRIRYCYQRQLTRDPGLGGKVVIKFVIGKDGRTTTAQIKSTTLKNAATEQCIVGQFQKMKFEAPLGGGIVIVSYPFLFSAG